MTSCACGVMANLIGGAERAAELDAMRAIDQGTRLASALRGAKYAAGRRRGQA